MTLILELAPEEEAQLAEQAQSAGLSGREFAKLTLLEDGAEAARRIKRKRAQAVLQGWIEEADAASPEEREAADKEWHETMKALDEDRGEDKRKLFAWLEK